MLQPVGQPRSAGTFAAGTILGMIVAMVTLRFVHISDSKAAACVDPHLPPNRSPCLSWITTVLENASAYLGVPCNPFTRTAVMGVMYKSIARMVD